MATSYSVQDFSFSSSSRWMLGSHNHILPNN